VVLVEDMVSRKHAKISFTNEALLIEDLGSTNGTFVNGEKVKRARLKEGDRVLIGTSIVRVEASDAPAGAGESREAEARAKMQSVASRTTQVKTMSGTIDEVPLVDLLQLFATSKKSGRAGDSARGRHQRPALPPQGRRALREHRRTP
jgi:pSer/pThr/pTyr-binding forkhead associated (FHA) protein